MSETGTQPNALRLAAKLRIEVDSTVGVVKYSTALQSERELRAQHELIQKLKAALEGCIDEAEEAVTNHVLSYGEQYKPARLAALRKQVADAREAIAAAEAKA